MPKPPGISSLETHLGYWLRFVSNHVSHAFKTKVEAHKVTVAEWVVMRALWDAEAINPSQLAEHIGLTRGTVSKLVDRLAAKNLLSCRAEKTDRRYQSLALTDAGRKLLPTLAALADQNDHEFFSALNPREQAALTEILKKIVHRHNLRTVPVD